MISPLIFPYVAMITSLVLAILLFFKKEQHGFSSKIMGVVFLFWSLIFLYYTLEVGDDYVLYYHGDIIYGFLTLFVIPLQAIYFCFLTENRVRLSSALWLFIPPLLVWMSVVVLFVLVGEDAAVIFVRNTYFEADLPEPHTITYQLLRLADYSLFNVIMIAEMLGSMLYVRVLLHRYSRRLKDCYSNVDDKDELATYFVFYAIFALQALTLLYATFVAVMRWPNLPVQQLMYVVFAVVLFMVGRSVLNLRFTSADLEYQQAQVGQEPAKSEPLAEMVNDTMLSALNKRLQQLMDSEKLYLQSNLTLDDLSQKLGTNRTYLSQLLNKTYGVRFSDYINMQRVAHAEILLMEPNVEYSLDWIATESGFSSTSTFYRAFRQKHGCTPSAWRKGSN